MKLIKAILKLPAKLTLTPESEKQQKALIESAKTVATVPANATEQQTAVSIGQDLRRHLNQTEKDRKALVAPALEWQRQVNKLAKEHCGPIAKELDRVEDLADEFKRADDARVARELAERSAELARLQAPVETNGDVSMQELVAYRNEQAAEELMREPLPEPVQVSGAVTRKPMRYEVTDINALYAARPDLCHPPTPRGGLILQVCTPEISVPGLCCWYETETIIRSR